MTSGDGGGSHCSGSGGIHTEKSVHFLNEAVSTILGSSHYGTPAPSPEPDPSEAHRPPW